MAKLKRDERVCPYCAETIKAAATRCRFCHSDVTPVVEPERQSEVEPERAHPPPPPPPPSQSGPGVEKPARHRTLAIPSLEDVRSFVVQRLTLVLAALVVLAAVGVGVSWWRAEQGSSEVAPGGALVGDDARTQVLVAAADLTKRTLSYDHKTLENDMEVARARMTPSFRKEYDGTMKQVRANTEKNKISLEAVPVSSAIIKATKHQATVLVFVNQTTTAGTGKKRNQQLNRNSLVITLTRGEGDWAMHKLTALG
jgi:Mce-associated membrane protein